MIRHAIQIQAIFLQQNRKILSYHLWTIQIPDLSGIHIVTVVYLYDWGTFFDRIRNTGFLFRDSAIFLWHFLAFLNVLALDTGLVFAFFNSLQKNFFAII